MKTRTPGRSSGPAHDRWLVSYADFITLLFAVFVVLFAASNADKEKMRTFARAVENAIGHSGVGHHAPAHVSHELESTYLSLAHSLRPEIDSDQVTVSLDARGLVITLNQTAFFESGSSDFDPSMYPTLGKIAGAIARIDNPIRLEGHTDARPIHNDRFRNNWELSSARSIAVLELLETRFGITSRRMAIAGYADTVPLSEDDTDEGRARNRRVDIVVLSRDGMRKEPGRRF
jgi:chemotaxis protein MotB